MMRTTRSIWVLLGLWVILGHSNIATACSGPYHYGYALIRSAYLPGYSYYLQEHRPYFAVYPPVYYSYKMLRPLDYGRSSYPSRPKLRSSASSPPLRIRNPYVTQTKSSTATPRPQPGKPLRIVNPYVAQVGDPGVSALATMPRRPQVIHPARATEPSP